MFFLVAADAVIPIFPGETTLNAASTFAANGDLELWLVIVLGALGALIGDSSLYWIARRSGVTQLSLGVTCTTGREYRYRIGVQARDGRSRVLDAEDDRNGDHADQQTVFNEVLAVGAT